MSANPQALKAEIILAIQLVTRHRAFRMTAALCGLALLGNRVAAARPLESAWAVAGALGAVAGSRVLSRGAALASARLAAAPFRSVAGRFIGVMAVIAPLTAVGAAVAGTPMPLGVSREVGVGVGYAAVLTAVAMGGTGMVGASSAATFGVFAAWVGQLPPGAWSEQLGAAGGLALGAWSALPMAWRVAAAASGDPASFRVLAAWGMLGLGGAVLGVARRRRLR